MGDNTNLIDCYFYCYKTCRKESWCPFRHCEEASKSNEVCQNWLVGNCNKDNCPKRHMDIEGICRTLKKGNLASKLMTEGLERKDALDVAKAYIDFDSDPSLLQQTCEICTEEFSRLEMIDLMTCQHAMCISCAREHYETQIRQQGISKVVCPFPNCTTLQDKTEAEIHEYFSMIISQLKEILSEETIELLENKIRDRTLMKDPNFVWCPQCESGMFREENFLGINENLKCPNCNHCFCVKCKKPWMKQHVGLTCEQFESWQNSNDPERQTNALQNFLDKFGVACPRCHTKFVKSPGGCIHFHCPVPTCEHDFCEGCLKPFYQGKACPDAKSGCAAQGFHAHHPRNCFFYLRDWEPKRLQALLAKNDIKFETKPMHSGLTCPLVEQKEKDNEKLHDEECGSVIEPNFYGLCRKHYIQYLGWLVLKNKVDPLPFYTIEELTNLITKAGVVVPEPTSAPNYQQILIEKVKKLQTSGEISECTTIAEAFAAVLKVSESSDEENLDGCYADAQDVAVVLSSDESEVEEIEAAGAVAVETGSWQCSSCTYINEKNSKICMICSRSQIIGFEDFEFENDDIVQCYNCTLYNEKTSKMCEICGYLLPHDPVEID